MRHARAALVEPMPPRGARRGPSQAPMRRSSATPLASSRRLADGSGTPSSPTSSGSGSLASFRPRGSDASRRCSRTRPGSACPPTGSSASSSRRSSSPGGETVPITSSARNGSRATSSARLRVVGRHRSRLPPRPSSVSSSVSSSSSTGLTAARRSSARPARSEPGRGAAPANAGPCGASRPSSPRSGLVGRGRDRPWRLPRTARHFLDDRSPDEAVIGAARDVIMLHVGAPSKLYAALAWTLVHVLTEPGVLERVRSGDDAFLERCASESIRLAQRSSRGARS